MPKSRRRQRAADTARLRVSPLAIEAVIEGDKRFFQRFPGRRHRIRLTARAEFQQAERGGSAFAATPAGTRWFTVVGRIEGGRLRHFVQLGEHVDTDMPEAFCADLFAFLRGGAEQGAETGLVFFGAGHE